MPAPYDIICKVVNATGPKTVGVRKFSEHKSYRGEDYTLNFRVSLGLQRDFFM